MPLIPLVNDIDIEHDTTRRHFICIKVIWFNIWLMETYTITYKKWVFVN